MGVQTFKAGGDVDFGPEVHFGTPALRGMREGYLRDSLVAYRDGTRRHEEMSAVAAMLDDDIEAVAHYYESAQEQSGTEKINTQPGPFEGIGKPEPLN